MGSHAFSTLIVGAAPDIETAAFVVEQVARVREEVGPVEAFLGFNPRRMKMDPGPKHAEGYARSFYWAAFLRIPQFVDRLRPSLAFYLAVAAKTAWSVAAVAVPAFARMILGARTDAFFESVKRHRLRGIEAGAQVISDYLRGDLHSRGDLRIHPPFFWTLASCHFYVHYWLDVGRGEDFSRILFLTPETTYRTELVRRALLKRGASEVYCDRWDGGEMRISNRHREGRELVICAPTRERLAAAEAESVRDELHRRIQGEASYPYMGADVDGKVAATFSVGTARDAGSGEPQAVIYMHAVADAQHYFGDDCFVDLDHWLRTSVDLLLAEGFTVYLKMHPCYYDSNPKRAADQRYRRFIEDYFRASWGSLAPGEIGSTGFHERLRIIDYRLDIRSIHACLGVFLCVTHHGTIATEATAIGLPAVCSVANAFQRFPAFAWTYSDLGEYRQLLAEYRNGRLKVTEERLANLYLYLFESRRDNWAWIWREYTRLCGYNFVDDPNRFVEFLLAVDPLDDHDLYVQVRDVFACRQHPRERGDPPSPIADGALNAR